MPNSVSFEDGYSKNVFANGRIYVHEYRFEYDVNGEISLERCIIDIVAFIADYSRDEVKSLVHQHWNLDIDDHFSMLDQLEKSKLTFWIGDLDITVNYDGEILVQKSKTP